MPFAGSTARFILAGALALGLVARADADCTLFPSPLTSTLPSHVLLLGRDGLGEPDPRGEFVVIVRDGCMNLVAGQMVEISFLDCGGVRFARDGYPPGVTPDCRPTRMSVRRTTLADGEARFNIPGTAADGGFVNPHCMVIRVEGSFFGAVHIATADLDGNSGVSANDLSEFLGAFGREDASTADLDGSGAIGANDLSIWLAIFGGGGSLVTPAPLCP